MEYRARITREARRTTGEGRAEAQKTKASPPALGTRLTFTSR